MYYANQKVYIINGVLYDLNRFKTYKIEDEVQEIFNAFHLGITPVPHTDNPFYEQIRETYFSRKSDNELITLKENIFNVQVKVSNTCNLKCTYCYANQGNYGKKDKLMDIETALKVANLIKTEFTGIEKVSFFGGEPLMNVDAIEAIIREIDNNDIVYSMITNGTYMNDRILKLIEDYKVHLIVSLDGPKEINDTNRIFKNGKGTFDVISENIDKAHAINESVKMIASVYSKPSADCYTKTELYDYLYTRFKVPAVGVADVVTSIESLQLPASTDVLMLSPTDLLNHTIDLILSKKYFQVNTAYDAIVTFFNKGYASYFCYAGIASVFIDEDGHTCPCQMFESDSEFYMGNINTDGLYLENPDYLNTLQRLKSVNKKTIETCKDCAAQFWCFRCIGQHKEENNFGACRSSQSCDYNQSLTSAFFERLSKIIQEGQLDHFIECLNTLSATKQ